MYKHYKITYLNKFKNKYNTIYIDVTIHGIFVFIGHIVHYIFLHFQYHNILFVQKYYIKKYITVSTLSSDDFENVMIMMQWKFYAFIIPSYWMHTFCPLYFNVFLFIRIIVSIISILSTNHSMYTIRSLYYFTNILFSFYFWKYI